MDPASRMAAERLAPLLPAADRPMMAKLLTYLNRNSLWLVRFHGTGEELDCEFGNDCERLALSLAELRQMAAELGAGRRIDWSVYRRLK